MAPGAESPPDTLSQADRLWRRVEAIAQRSARRLARDSFGVELRAASVLVPFYRVQDRPYLLFTKRTDDLPTHKGQISFPGGAAEPGDADPSQTALRETCEELGIPPDAVRLIGPFDDVTSIAGFRVTPIVGEIPTPPVPRINPTEVEAVIEVDVIRLMDEKIHRTVWVTRDGRKKEIHFYDCDPHVIWGLTGRIVHGLLEWLRGVDGANEP